ncbi:MAG: hypothetical protein KDJ36_00625 [Hyphomicrobiaceae bacterium]|nr:hypothetical protein [Hyphomicrobiaceae bacterium]
MLELFRITAQCVSDVATQFATASHSFASAGFALLAFRVNSGTSHAKTEARAFPMTPQRPLGPRAPNLADVHIARVAEVVRKSVESAERASGLHQQAATKLDATEYALNRLVDELSAVMTTPVALRGYSASKARTTPALSNGLRLAA